MKFIENKKLFGKVNLIDILLVVIVLVGGFIAYKKVFNNDSSVNIGAKYSKINFLFRVQDARDNYMNYLKEGTEVYDNETNQYIGKLVSFYSGDYITSKIDLENSKLVSNTISDRINVYLKIESEVAESKGDFINASNYYIKIGKYVNLRTGKFASGGYILTIDRDPQTSGDKFIKQDNSIDFNVHIEDLANTSKDAFRVGDDIYDKITSAYLGKISDVKISTASKLLDHIDGTTSWEEDPNRIDVDLVINAVGEEKNGEYIINGLTRIQVGSFKTFKTDYIMCSGWITGIEE